MNLLAAALLLLVTSGRWAIPLAAWASPIFLLRFTRGPGAGRRLLAAFLTVYAVQCLTWHGLVPVAAPLYYAIVLGLALVSLLPYAIDRLLERRVGGFVSTLVFPCACVAVEFLNGLASPYGSWGSMAYTQADQLPLIQLVS